MSVRDVVHALGMTHRVTEPRRQPHEHQGHGCIATESGQDASKHHTTSLAEASVTKGLHTTCAVHDTTEDAALRQYMCI